MLYVVISSAVFCLLFSSPPGSSSLLLSPILFSSLLLLCSHPLFSCFISLIPIDIFHRNCLIVYLYTPHHTTTHHTTKHHTTQNLTNELSSVLEVLMLHDRSSSRIFGTDIDLKDYENERKELQDILYEDLSKNEKLGLHKKKYKNQILELKKMLREILKEKKSKIITLDEEKDLCVEVIRGSNALNSVKEGREEGSDSAVDGLVDRTVTVAAQPSFLTSLLTSTSTSTSTSISISNCGVNTSPSYSLSSPPITTTTTTSIQCSSSPSSPSSSSYNQSKCMKTHLNAATSIFAEVLLCVGSELYCDKNELIEEEILLHNDIKKCRKEVRILFTFMFTNGLIQFFNSFFNFFY